MSARRPYVRVDAGGFNAWTTSGLGGTTPMQAVAIVLEGGTIGIDVSDDGGATTICTLIPGGPAQAFVFENQPFPQSIFLKRNAAYAAGTGAIVQIVGECP